MFVSEPNSACHAEPVTFEFAEPLVKKKSTQSTEIIFETKPTSPNMLMLKQHTGLVRSFTHISRVPIYIMERMAVATLPPSFDLI